jgi:TDG/mug DNA glycosylase family protein
VSFTRAELLSYTGASLPDVLSDGVELLFCGINPGLRSAAIGASFANRGNRFWSALHLAGITDRMIDSSAGFDLRDLAELAYRRVGLTTLVNYATAKASELTDAQLIAGRSALERTAETYRPRVIALLGVTAYRIAFEEPRAVPGRQQQSLGASTVWVVPSPSGLNAHYSLAQLAAAYREAAVAAGIEVDER